MKRHILFLLSILFFLNQPLYGLYGMEYLKNLLHSIFQSQPQQETVVLDTAFQQAEMEEGEIFSVDEQTESIGEELVEEGEVVSSDMAISEEVEEQQEEGVDILDELENEQMSAGGTPTGSRGIKDIPVTIGKAAGVFAAVFVGYLLVYATNVSVRNKTNKTLRLMRDALKRAVKRKKKQEQPVEKKAAL